MAGLVYQQRYFLQIAILVKSNNLVYCLIDIHVGATQQKSVVFAPDADTVSTVTKAQITD